MGGQFTTILNALDQSVLAPFFVVDIHRLRNTISEKYNLISCPKRESFLLVAAPQKPDYRTTSFQAQNLARGRRIAQDHRWVVTSVDIGECGVAGSYSA